MQPFIASVYKEILLLLRDRGGLAVGFLMPVALIIIMVFIQDRTFQVFHESMIDVIIMDEDHSEVSRMIINELDEQNIFKIHTQVDDATLTNESAIEAVSSGAFRALIILTKGLSAETNRKVYGFFSEDSIHNSTNSKIEIFYDPGLKESFRQLIHAAIQKVTAEIQSELFIRQLVPALAMILNRPNLSEQEILNKFKRLELLPLNEQMVSTGHVFVPNSVQHNVPAWTMFAMFFIVIPLSGSIIREREEGSLARLRTLPINAVTILNGKIVTYLIVCLIQTTLLILIGKYLMPVLGFAELQIGNSLVPLASVVVTAALAATGYGIFVGYYFRTHHQAASFGAISVIIAAAVGGIWVPVFIMPEIMRLASVLSPLGWGLNAFHDVFLRDAGLDLVVHNIMKLLLFFVLMILLVMVKFRKGLR